MTFHISSLIILSIPKSLPILAEKVKALEGAEITNSDDIGKTIVVLESENENMITDTIEQLREIQGVVSVSLSYHHSE